MNKYLPYLDTLLVNIPALTLMQVVACYTVTFQSRNKAMPKIHTSYPIWPPCDKGECSACVYRVMDARRKFGEHERSGRLQSLQIFYCFTQDFLKGIGESNPSFLSALQTSQVHP